MYTGVSYKKKQKKENKKYGKFLCFGNNRVHSMFCPTSDLNEHPVSGENKRLNVFIYIV